MHRRPLYTALAVLAIAALVSACGGSSGGSSGSSSSGVSAADYVKAICTAVGPFEKDVAARSQRAQHRQADQRGSRARRPFRTS